MVIHFFLASQWGYWLRLLILGSFSYSTPFSRHVLLKLYLIHIKNYSCCVFDNEKENKKTLVLTLAFTKFDSGKLFLIPLQPLLP